MKTPSPELIKQLEDLDVPATDKFEFLLVLAGEKPATSWSWSETIYPPGRPPQHHGRTQFDRLVKWAEAARLNHEVITARVNTARLVFGGIEGQRLREDLAAKHKPVDVEAEIAAAADEDRLTIFVARDKTWLHRLMEADRHRDPQLLGECFGFPPAAVTAYVNRRVISPGRVKAPTETQVFAQFMLSRDHARADLETAQRWAAAVKRLSPTLHAAIVENQAGRERLQARQLRVMLLATGLLLVAQIGQFIAVRDYNTAGHLSGLAILFAIAEIFIVPTSLILSVAIILSVRHWWREHERIMLLGGINLLIALNLVWFFVNACSWSQVFGLALRTCH